MKHKKSQKPEYAKETPEARKKRVSSGVKFRAVVFKDKRDKLREKASRNEDSQ